MLFEENDFQTETSFEMFDGWIRENTSPGMRVPIELRDVKYQITRAPEGFYLVTLETGCQRHVVAKIVNVEHLVPFLKIHSAIEQAFREFQRAEMLKP